jgi:type II secretory pathway pseudopilin PulG
MSTRKVILIIILILGCVSIAIIALLAGLSIWGVSSAQQSLRDTQRKSTLMDVNVMLETYYSKVGSYPAQLVLTEQLITFASKDGKSLDIDFVNLKSPLTGSTETTQTTTAYCYAPAGQLYKLGIKLESGKWYDIGTGECTDADKLSLDSIPATELR